MPECQVNITDLQIITTQPTDDELILVTSPATGATYFRSLALIRQYLNGGITQGLPVANAGVDKVVVEPSNLVVLTGGAHVQGGTIVSYLWEKISGPAGGAIVTPTFATTAITGLTTGEYEFRLTAKDNLGQTAMDSVKVTRQAAAVALSVTQHPTTQTVNAGSNVTFTVEVTGGVPPYAYSWRKDNVVMGITTQSLTVLNAQKAANEGDYDVVITDSNNNSIISEKAGLVIDAVVINPPSFVQHPISQSLVAGDTLTLSVNVIGTPPIAYQWRKNDVNIPGATLSTYQQTNVQEQDGATYKCIATNAAGSVSSNPASVYVSIESGTTHAVNYGWTLDPVDASNVDTIVLSRSVTVANNADNFVVDFRQAQGSWNFIVSEPASEPVKTSWYNTNLLNEPIGNMEASYTFAAPVVINGIRYYFTRDLRAFDSSATTKFSI